MLIRNKVRNIDKYLTHLGDAVNYYLGVPLSELDQQSILNLGFTFPANAGESILPPSRGPAGRRNIKGYEIVQRHLPKETMYRQIQWSWKERHGRDTIDRVGIKDVAYQRYPRVQVPPYGVELSVRESPARVLYVAAGPFSIGEDTIKAANSANLLVELLGCFEVLDQALTSWLPAVTRRMNWSFLPPGESPWLNAQGPLRVLLDRQSRGNQPVIKARFDAVGAYEPEFVGVGRGGLLGYVAFGFPRRGICLLESCQTNNATYVLNETGWEEISQMTKAEILNSDAHQARLIHNRGWFDGLSDLFSRAPG